MPWVASFTKESQTTSMQHPTPNTLLKSQRHPRSPYKKREKNHLWKRDPWGNLFGWRRFVTGSRDPSPLAWGGILSQENCLRKGGRSYRFLQVGKCSPSGWDPHGAISRAVIIMLMSSQTRQAHSVSLLPAPCCLGLSLSLWTGLAQGKSPSSDAGDGS